MKKYNLENYLRYKDDLKKVNSRIQEKKYCEYTRDELITAFLPLVENIAKKFSTADQASGIMDITDIIQEGSVGLIFAVDKIEWDKINESNDQEQTLKSFLSKRIKGSIRRAIDINRGSIRIPEHKLNEIRKDSNTDHRLLALFFSNMIESLDKNHYEYEQDKSEVSNLSSWASQYEDTSEKYNIDILNKFIISLFDKHLSVTESEVLRLSYGLDCDKHSANAIADILGFKGPSAYVRVSELKKFAISKLIAKCDPDQLLEYL
jgi:RNA polymerase sigma factor (sigma-70 family)